MTFEAFVARFPGPVRREPDGSAWVPCSLYPDDDTHELHLTSDHDRHQATCRQGCDPTWILGRVELRQTDCVVTEADRATAHTLAPGEARVWLAVEPTAIPVALRERPHWVVWRAEVRDGKPKPTKVPYQALAPTQHAKPNDPSTWAPFEAALAAYQRNTHALDGIGYVLADTDSFAGADIDHCRDPETGAVAPWAQAVVDRLQSYTEVSPSGTGLRIIAVGVLPPGRRSKGRLGLDHRGEIGLYDERRYLTMTGHSIPTTPPTIEPRQAELDALHAELFPPDAVRPAALPTTAAVDADDEILLSHARAAGNGAKFVALWAGDSTDYPSASEGDAALCTILAFWTGRDAARIDRLFRQSGRMRPKWDRVGPRTIAYAIGKCQETYAAVRAVTASIKTAPSRPTGKARPDQPPPVHSEGCDCAICLSAVTNDDHEPVHVDDTSAPEAPAEPTVPPHADTTAPPQDPEAAPVDDATLRIYTWRELVQGARRTIEYHWPGWIPRAAVALLVGAGETYKSWLALTIAVMTAAGRVLFARDDDAPLHQGPVLYLSAENSIEEEQRRCQLLQTALGLPDDLPITFLAADALNLSHDEDYTQVLARVKTTDPALVVVDSAIAVSGVVEERDNSAVRAFMQRRLLPLARRRNATVLVIGHSPKPSREAGVVFTDEQVARGAGDWRNASDVTLYLRREPSLGAQAVILRHAKARIGPRAAPLWFTLVEDPATSGVALTLGGAYDETTAQATGALPRAVAAALALLRATPTGVRIHDLVKQVQTAPPGTTTRTARRALDVLRGKPKASWPTGPRAGQVFAVVDEVKLGRSTCLLLDPTRVATAVSSSTDDEADLDA